MWTVAQEYRRMLEKALGDSANPLHIAEECLIQREKRQGIDLVNDEVEKALIKEVEVIKRCQARMKKNLDKAFVQLKWVPPYYVGLFDVIW